MKKSSLIFAFFLYIFSALAQDNPFAEYGYTPKIATLSQGQYNESFDNDSIVQIGSVLFNTKSNQIVAFVEYDTLYSEATLEPDIVSRWMSPDPLAKIYPDMSPYVGMGNNPIFLTDPDGRILRDANGNIVYTLHSSGKYKKHKNKVNALYVTVYTNDKQPIRVTLITSITNKDVSKNLDRFYYICHSLTMLDRIFIANSELDVSNRLVLDKMGLNNESPENVKNLLSYDLDNAKENDIIVFIGNTYDDYGNLIEEDVVIHTAKKTADSGKYLSKNGYEEEGEFNLEQLKDIYGSQIGYFTPVEDKKIDVVGEQGFNEGTVEIDKL